MNGAELVNRIVLIGGGIAALFTLFLHMLNGRPLLYGAYWAACCMFAVSLILMFTMRGILHVLYTFLEEKRNEGDGEVTESESEEEVNEASENGTTGRE